MLEHPTTRTRNIPPAEQQTWLRPEEAARYIRVGRTTMYKLLRDGDGEVPSVRVGRVRLIRRSDLDSYLERKFEGAEE